LITKKRKSILPIKKAIVELKEQSKWDAFDYQMGKHLGKVYQEIEDNDI